ncbi:MAG: response regulator [Alphaproteobacteria bacterium]|nr:response regulator [Alphaproteobacteria bacterium]
MKLLLVEDDIMIGEGLQKALRRSGYSVDWVQDGFDVEQSLESHSYCLVILDLGLPNKNGLAILQDLRKNQNDIPVLVLTARDAVLDRVKGLDSGADDYMLKPFALEELEARIRLLLRRKENQRSPLIALGDLELNPATHEAIYKDKKYVLSGREFSLMRILAENPGVIYSRAQLEEKLYGWNEEVESNSVEVHIYQLRKKLGKGIIKNTRGVGYAIGECS